MPEIVDEAADTPGWVPALGVGVFALIALAFALRLAHQEANPPKADADPKVAEVAADGERD